MVFTPHPDAECRVRSAIVAIKALLPLGLYPSHLREFLSVALWKITEAHGKYKTRFQSQASLAEQKDLQHEHVFQRAKMVAALIDNPEQVEATVAKAVGCVVTKKEHVRLGEVDRKVPGLDGWERYREAEIVVIDTETGAIVELA